MLGYAEREDDRCQYLTWKTDFGEKMASGWKSNYRNWSGKSGTGSRARKRPLFRFVRSAGLPTKKNSIMFDYYN